jgi:outer membrane lipoprotein-sorting protein
MIQSTLLTLLVTSFFSVSAQAQSVAPEEILKRADDIRNPSESYFMKVRVFDDGNTTGSSSLYEIAIQGNTKTLVKTLEPPRDRERSFLMLDEDIWAYIPNLKRAVRVSLSQRLSGQVARGDISRMRWAGDYTPTIEKEDDKTWLLFLTAKKKGLTYEKLRVWIEKSTFRPLKADFLSLDGKPMKNTVYRNYTSLAGKLRPKEIFIKNATNENDQSLIQISEMKVQSFPSSLFNQTNLGK